MRRREFLQAGVAGVAALTVHAPASQAQTPPGTDDVDYDSIFDEVSSEVEALGDQKLETVGGAEFTADFRSVLDQKKMKADFPTPPLTEEVRARLRGRKYWGLPTTEQPIPSWPAIDRAPDSAHLSVLPLTKPQFTLSGGVLRLLAERNAFDLSRTPRPVIAFGLRGCRLSSGTAGAAWAKEQNLEIIEPDHISSKCILGLWRRSDDAIAVFQASTVPAVAHMYMSLAEQGAGTSLLPTGLYPYRVGTHLSGKPKSIQRGALRISERYVVLRTARDLEFDPHADTTAWTRGDAHNIHAGGRASMFSCAGCQVLPGGYSGAERKTSTGDWATFQAMAGLVDAAGDFARDEASPSFLYMLLTGYEAAVASSGGSAFDNGYYRLRPGSRGPDVLQLQKDLLKRYPDAVGGLSASGIFDMFTSFAVLIDRQKQTGQYTSPVVAI